MIPDGFQVIKRGEGGPARVGWLAKNGGEKAKREKGEKGKK